MNIKAPNTLGGRLKQLRNDLYMRQPEMAQFIGISLSLYTKLEANRIETSGRTLARIADKLKTTVEYLRDGLGSAHASERSHEPIASQAIAAMDEGTLTKIVSLALDEKYRQLATGISERLNMDYKRVLAMIIRTVLLDPKSQGKLSIDQLQPPSSEK